MDQKKALYRPSADDPLALEPVSRNRIDLTTPLIQPSTRKVTDAATDKEVADAVAAVISRGLRAVFNVLYVLLLYADLGFIAVAALQTYAIELTVQQFLIIAAVHNALGVIVAALHTSYAEQLSSIKDIQNFHTLRRSDNRTIILWLRVLISAVILSDIAWISEAIPSNKISADGRRALGISTWTSRNLDTFFYSVFALGAPLLFSLFIELNWFCRERKARTRVGIEPIVKKKREAPTEITPALQAIPEDETESDNEPEWM